MKKIFTLFALVMMAMGVSAQEVALFDNGGTYGNGATLSTANAQVVLNSAVQPAMYRVVATTFETKAEAAASRNDLQTKYPGAWLLYAK